MSYFEAGVFFTQLGRKRTLLVAPWIDTDGAVDFHLPSDLDGLTLILDGLTLIKYRSFRDKTEMSSRLGPACTEIRNILESFDRLPDERLREYLSVLSGGLIYLLRLLSYRSLGHEDVTKIIAHFNHGDTTNCSQAWQRTAKYAVRALTAMGLVTSDAHGCSITGLGRTILENRFVRERNSRALGIELVGIP